MPPERQASQVLHTSSGALRPMHAIIPSLRGCTLTVAETHRPKRGRRYYLMTRMGWAAGLQGGLAFPPIQRRLKVAPQHSPPLPAADHRAGWPL